MTSQPEVDRLMSGLDPLMIVVTVAARDEADGCLVGFHTQCSIDPARYLVLLSDKNRTFRLAHDADTMAVHVLAADQVALARHFGELTADTGVDKLADVAWTEVDGTPVLDDPPMAFTARILERIPVGDHRAHLLEPLTVVRSDARSLLRFQAVSDLDAGHAP